MSDGSERGILAERGSPKKTEAQDLSWAFADLPSKSDLQALHINYKSYKNCKYSNDPLQPDNCKNIRTS